VNTVLYPGRGDIYGVIAKKGLYNVALRHTNCAGILSHLAQHSTHDFCLNEIYFAHCLITFCLQVARVGSDFQICETASDITCSISKYWKQVNEISDEGAFGMSTPLSRCQSDSEARRSSCATYLYLSKLIHILAFVNLLVNRQTYDSEKYDMLNPRCHFHWRRNLLSV